jgi:hypothetical protein
MCECHEEPLSRTDTLGTETTHNSLDVHWNENQLGWAGDNRGDQACGDAAFA